MDYKMLLSPMKIGKVKIKNRVVMSPMLLNFGQINGNATEAMINYYEERAKGGTGLIITEITRINDVNGASSMGQLSVSHDYNIEPLKKMASRIHMHGAKLFIQLHHPGRQNMELMIHTLPISILIDKVFSHYKDLLWKVIPLGKKLMDKNLLPLFTVSASKTSPSYVSNSKVRGLHKSEIKNLVKQFVDSAIRAKKADCDGVELHGTHGYLIQQFISPYTNTRTDEYGGSFVNRMRFLTEIYNGIREKCGKEFPIIVRMTADECYDKIGKEGQGYGLDTGIEIAKYLEKLGVDALDVSSASYDTFNYWLEPTSFKCGWRKYMAKAIKDNVSIPILAANLIRSPEQAEQQLEEGTQDFISLGRPHIADPYWTKKVIENRPQDISRCICCLYCIESMMEQAFKGGHATCAINPTVGKETEVEKISKDGNGRKIVVVGAGVAGLTCAKWLAFRGFDVTILEKENQVGGQLQLANKPPHKEKISWCFEDLLVACKKQGVKFVLDTLATNKIIESYDPYAIVIATGGHAIVPKFLANLDNDNLFTTTKILSGEVEIKNKNVVLIGSGMTGLETAELLVENNNKVTIVEMADKIAPKVWFQHLDDIVPKLLKKDTQILTSHKLTKVEKNGIIALNMKTNKEITIDADVIVLSMGVASNNELTTQVDGNKYKLYSIGDAAITGRIVDATTSAYDVAINQII